MALQCGTTGDGCNGKVGLIRVEYTIPQAGYVRYKYPSDTDWVKVIGGVRYTTQLTDPQLGQCLVNYRIGIYVEVDHYQFVGGVPCPGVFQGKKYVCAQFPNVPGKIIEIKAYRQISSMHTCRNVPGTADHFLFEVVSSIGGSYYKASEPRCYRSTKPTTYATCVNEYDSRAHHYQNSTNPIGIYQRIDGGLDNCGSPGQCIFKVFDISDKIIYQETRSICPIAEAMPSIYGNNKGELNVKNTDLNKPLKIINSETNNIKSTIVQLGATTIKKLDSPEGSTLHPKVCWDCEEDKCPENTCSVDCGAHICCYDKNGIAVKTILK